MIRKNRCFQSNVDINGAKNYFSKEKNNFLKVNTKNRSFPRNVDIKKVLGEKRFFRMITKNRCFPRNVDIKGVTNNFSQ